MLYWSYLQVLWLQSIVLRHCKYLRWSIPKVHRDSVNFPQRSSTADNEHNAGCEVHWWLVSTNTKNLHSWLFYFVMITLSTWFTWFCRFFNNAYYAKVGGVSTAELNKLEMKFLFSIDFRLQVNIQTFGRYCYQLEKEGTETRQIERSIRACRLKESWSNKDEKSCASTTARWFFLPQATVCKLTTFFFHCFIYDSFRKFALLRKMAIISNGFFYFLVTVSVSSCKHWWESIGEVEEHCLRIYIYIYIL